MSTTESTTQSTTESTTESTTQPDTQPETQPEGVPGADEQAPLSRRERVRAATVAEIKAVTLELMRERGTTQVGFTDIARAMGMTAPALYRYYADRDDLLTACIHDSFTELGRLLDDGVRAVRDSGGAGGAGGVAGEADGGLDWARLYAGMTTYRTWAKAHPEQFALIFGPPVPGLVVDEAAGTTEAASGAMAVLEGIVLEALACGRVEPSVVSFVEPTLAAVMTGKHTAGEQPLPDLPPAACQGVLQAWMAIHGYIALETSGHLDWLPESTREGLFDAQVELAARGIGIRVPERSPHS